VWISLTILGLTAGNTYWATVPTTTPVATPVATAATRGAAGAASAAASAASTTPSAKMPAMELLALSIVFLMDQGRTAGSIVSLLSASTSMILVRISATYVWQFLSPAKYSLSLVLAPCPKSKMSSMEKIAVPRTCFLRLFVWRTSQ